jgi:uncharacterized protein YcsI (UPF0317 family)/threonine dehydratase
LDVARALTADQQGIGAGPDVTGGDHGEPPRPIRPADEVVRAPGCAPAQLRADPGPRCCCLGPIDPFTRTLTTLRRMLSPELEEVREAQVRLRDRIRRTPVTTSESLDAHTGATVLAKAESLQLAGSFKLRGALAKLSTLAPEDRRRGVLSYGGVNHARAVALAGRLLGAPVTILAVDHSRADLDRLRRLAEVFPVAGEDPVAAARRLALERSAILVAPDDPAVIAGHGTVALELLDEVGDLDLLLVPVGSGGLLAGTSVAAAAGGTDLRIVGVRSDGTRAAAPLPFDHEVVAVDAQQVAQAMAFAFDHLALVLEPAGAAALAALLAGAVDVSGTRVGVILTGGNIGLERFVSLTSAARPTPAPAALLPVDLSAAELRARIRAGRWPRPTSGCARGHEQANMVILPAEHAADFEAFCRSNPQACPLLEMTEPGSPHPASSPGADLRTDLPRYNVFRDGVLVEKPESIEHVWRDDLVAFLIGCSFSFEEALMRAGISLRHVAQGCNVAMHRTTVPCHPVGPFSSDIVVSMRPIPSDRLEETIAICAAHVRAHGAPLGTDPAALGVRDLARPEFGDAVAIHDGELPVFWACGVTATQAAAHARLPLFISHAPGHMFVSDRRPTPVPPLPGAPVADPFHVDRLRDSA